jgi:hypothetical protein
MQTNREFLREFIAGASFCLLTLGVFVLFIYGMNGIAEQQEAGKKPEQRFKIVDKYGPCEVVRYSPKNGANYAYFLDCK